MSAPDVAQGVDLILDLERRQDEVLRELDLLSQRLDEVLRQYAEDAAASKYASACVLKPNAVPARQVAA